MNPSKQEFNEYCAGVMGYKPKVGAVGFEGGFIVVTEMMQDFYWNPYDDLNQRAEVVEKKLDEDFESGIERLNMYLNEGHSVNIRQAFRDFIISTMGEKDGK